MQLIIRIVFLYFTTLPVKSNPNAVQCFLDFSGGDLKSTDCSVLLFPVINCKPFLNRDILFLINTSIRSAFATSFALGSYLISLTNTFSWESMTATAGPQVY